MHTSNQPPKTQPSRTPRTRRPHVLLAAAGVVLAGGLFSGFGVPATHAASLTSFRPTSHANSLTDNSPTDHSLMDHSPTGMSLAELVPTVSGPRSAASGQTVTIMAGVQNEGIGAASNVLLEVDTPLEFVFISSPGVNCGRSEQGSLMVVSCTIPEVAARSSYTLTLLLKVPTTAAPGSVLETDVAANPRQTTLNTSQFITVS